MPFAFNSRLNGLLEFMALYAAPPDEFPRIWQELLRCQISMSLAAAEKGLAYIFDVNNVLFDGRF